MIKKKFVTILKWGALLGAGLSLIKLLSFCGEKVSYNFGPVSDLLMVVLCVLLIYMGIREIRDRYQDGVIRFTRAFAIGTGIVAVAYLVVSLYMMLHFNVIQPDGVDQINTKNIEKKKSSILADTLTDAELTQYIQDIRKSTADRIIQVCETDSAQNANLAGANKIINLFETRIQGLKKEKKTDFPSVFQLDTFDVWSVKMLRFCSIEFIPDSTVDSMAIAAVRYVADSAYPEPAADKRLHEAMPQIPQFTSKNGAAFITSFPVLLYGILLNIFVALYLYRKEKRVCPAEETPEEPDTEMNQENTAGDEEQNPA
ncbi:MAG: DUF4199 domain-containing protein [Bacteroidales bacterium]|nr:DUF4199 domain-containing protein [Bacteroidales bacterium]